MRRTVKAKTPVSEVSCWVQLILIITKIYVALNIIGPKLGLMNRIIITQTVRRYLI